MTRTRNAPRPAQAALALIAALAALALAGCSGGSNSGGNASPVVVAARAAITGISPTSGPAGTLVTINGTGFTNVTAVRFGSTDAASYTVVSPTEITAVVPTESVSARPRVPGDFDVTVVTAAGTSAATSADMFSYAAAPAPAVSALSSSAGPTAGGTSVTITGSGFLPGSTVHFGTTAATSVTYNSSTSLTATSPEGSAGVVDVTVTDANGTSAAVTADQFTYAGTPTVTGLSPSDEIHYFGSGGGTTVTITGTGFLPGCTVHFGGAGNATNVTVVSLTEITATAPPDPSPSDAMTVVGVTVTDSEGTSADTNADHFTYVYSPL